MCLIECFPLNRLASISTPLFTIRLLSFKVQCREHSCFYIVLNFSAYLKFFISNWNSFHCYFHLLHWHVGMLAMLHLLHWHVCPDWRFSSLEVWQHLHCLWQNMRMRYEGATSHVYVLWVIHVHSLQYFLGKLIINMTRVEMIVLFARPLKSKISLWWKMPRPSTSHYTIACGPKRPRKFEWM